MSVKLETRNLTFSFDRTPLIRGVSFTVEPGEVAIIAGRSGHGKSTLLELCSGLRTPRSGKVLWNNEDVEDFSRTALLRMRQSVGYVFQSHALISNHTVFDNIALPLRSRGGMSASFIEREVKRVIEELGIFGAENVYPEVLSSGQLKSVAVARALISKPEVLFLDEPLSGVDPVTAQGILNVLHSHWKKEGMSIILISHNLNVWPSKVKHKIVLDSGKICSAQNYPNIDREYKSI